MKTGTVLVYLFLFLVVSFLVLAVAVWLPNRELILWMFSQTHVGIGEKLQFLFSLLGGLETNFTLLSATSTILMALLFGLNVVLFIHYIRTLRAATVPTTVGATSLGGLISGFFGIGCASCGSIILATFLGQVGAGGLLFLLPFGGAEFGILAVLLLAYSAYVLIKKSRSPLVCDTSS